jgi:UDP-N-acetylmuramoyl-L-alanyl-D-glutamate--2,6-diaminopimelate ligase
MKHLLSNLLEGMEYRLIEGKIDVEVTAVHYDSRNIQEGSLFVCIHGFIVDGHSFVPDALEKKATVIIIQNDQTLYSEEQLIEFSKASRATVISVPDTRIGLAKISASFFQFPAIQLNLIGITGTKGKTTTTYMLHDIFVCAGKNTGLIGTVANIVSGEVRQASRTTPESYDLQKLLSEMVADGSDSCIMEVSSQGLMLFRVHGCSFSVGAFTNLYHDHIGEHEHKNMEEYLNAKNCIFDQSSCGVINLDTPVSEKVIDYAKKRCPVYTYGLSEDCDCRATEIRKASRRGIAGSEIIINSPWYQGKLFVALPGQFNVYNALCAISVSGICGIPFDAVKKSLARVSVPGRLQMIKNDNNVTVLVDYAHNAASLEILLETLREDCKGRLITVFGCGGNRSKTRRTEMGEVSGRLSDLTIVTSDNPRNEDPADIINNILSGLLGTGGKHVVEPDRRKAIEYAISTAVADDFVIIAGKGHENYQIFKDRTIHFDDVEVATEVIGAIAKRNEG